VCGLLSQLRTWPEVPLSDGFYESLGCDVIHFPTQSFTVCGIPSVYNPHDLQHLHYPQFFSASEIAWRETVYPAGCHFAKTVIVNSQWIKDDVTAQYGVAPAKVQVVPEAPPTQFAAEISDKDLQSTRARYALPDAFVLYPGVTWPHKNHARLFDALAHLRDTKGLIVPLVCTGARHDASWPQLQAQLSALRLGEQVRFLGFVPTLDLRCLYRLAHCLVMPTLFEANSLPVFEAWLEGTPVACSNVTALPEQIMAAGLLFDPHDSIAMADCIARLFQDDVLRADLRVKGHQRLHDFSWERTAKAYRAIYRRAAGQRLTAEDKGLLDWDWMRPPQKQ